MSTETKPLTSDALSRAIREKVAEANKLQRHLSEAAIRARQVLGSLRPTLDEIAAYMYRETGLDVVAFRQTPSFLTDPMADTPTARIAVEYREITVLTEPPTSLLGGFLVQVTIDGAVSIVAFWAAGDPRSGVAAHIWAEPFREQSESLDRSGTIRKVAEALFSRRLQAAEFLLDALNAE